MTYAALFAVNGVALQNDTYGWKVLRDGTSTKLGVSRNLSKVASPGRPGYTPAPTAPTEQLLIFTMRVKRTGLEALMTLLEAATVVTRIDDATRCVYVELASALVSSDAPQDLMQDVTVTLSAYEGVWRDVNSTDLGPTAITTPTQVIDILSGAISAPVYDADIYIRGVFGQFQLVDSRGSFLKSSKAWPGDSSHGMLWVGATSQAFLAADASPFVPVQDMSQYVDQSGNGGFRLTPQMVSGDPGTRRAELTLTTLTQASTYFRARIKSAYRIDS